MSQQLRYLFQPHPVIHQVLGERVPQRVRAYVFQPGAIGERRYDKAPINEQVKAPLKETAP